ncbi:hypothetical protein LO772_00450 [Yinghuangia sp. ASG 101]|nr:hypothetical protein [Yinghuangia sp. ASG 101]UGQ12116.1 hypothetical protein LO772_00450 [Yinghuangia sp. ASG 101]
MLTTSGGGKVLDFGIARYVESTHRSGKVMGTLAYMPPERFDEHRATPAPTCTPSAASSTNSSPAAPRFRCHRPTVHDERPPSPCPPATRRCPPRRSRTARRPGSRPAGERPAHRPASALDVGERLPGLAAHRRPEGGGTGNPRRG